MLIYPDEGLILLLKLVANNKGEGLTWALFDNDVEPDLDSVLGDFSLASDTWAQIVLDDDDFDLEQVLLHNGAIQAPEQEFTNTTGLAQLVYGYLVFDHVTQKLISVNRDVNAPVTVAIAGVYTITPAIGDYSDTSVPEIDGGTF